jgi:hypothetical protein
MTGIFIAVLLGGLWMVFSAIILISICITSSRFHQEECSVMNLETFGDRRNVSDRLEKRELSRRLPAVQN